MSDDKVWAFAKNILPKERFYDYNQALFDVGTVVKSGDLSSFPKELQELYKNIDTKKKKTKEKLYNGVPMRLYRGALVQCLRESKDHRATFEHCGTEIATKLAKQPVSFIKVVADKLARDGLVIVEKGSVRLV